jgi:tetratricopeptide (TPR) repeat protein
MKQSIIIGFLFALSLPCKADLQSAFNEAVSIDKAGDIQRASILYKEIILKNPACTPALYNYAHTLKDLGDMPQAIELYKKVIELEPENNAARLGLAQCYLSLGDFIQGFSLFEYRSRDIAQFKSHIDFLHNHIQQNSSLQGLTILLRSEWGMGDCMQFIRYAQELKKRGAKIILQAYPALQKLFSLCPYIDSVISIGDAFPDHHIQIPLLSLPHVLGNSFDHYAPSQPYLFADKQLTQQCNSILPQDKTLKIGICWCGNGDKNAPPLLNKNIPLNQLHDLFNLKNISFFCLQRLENKGEVTFPESLILFDENFDNHNGRFMDTAAVMMNLDLIITIDTSIAHLAGALGKKVWVMIPHRTDWRWLLNRTDSPFYPTMELLRQPSPGDWQSVVKIMSEKINKLSHHTQ